MNIKDATVEQLEKEIESRKKQNATPIPQLKSPRLETLSGLLADYVTLRTRGEYIDEDYPHWIMEEALRTFYGDEIFPILRNVGLNQ